MQSETWYQLVEKVFPNRKPEMDYLRAEPQRHLALAQAQSFGRAGNQKKTRAQREADLGSEREFLESLGHKRKPVPSKAVKKQPKAARYQQ